MALSFTARLFMNSRVLRTERILQSLPRSSVYEFSKTYINAVKQLNLENTFEGVSELVQFPHKAFHFFPHDCLKMMIEESLNTLKEKGKVRSVNIYNKMMYSLWNNKIDFDVDVYLQEIVNSQLRITSETFDIIIKCYSREKRAEDIENVLEKMSKENINLLRRSIGDVVYAYIVTGQEEKAKEFIKAKEIDENSSQIIISRLRAYAAIGDTERLFQLLDKFPSLMKPHFMSDFYLRMVKAKLSDSKLNEMTEKMDKESIFESIKNLNNAQFFSSGLRLLELSISNFSHKTVSNILKTFVVPACPINVFKTVLDLTLERIDRVYYDWNVFCYMSFEDALAYSMKNCDAANSRVLVESILYKAVITKSIDNIHEALQFCQTAVDGRIYNSTMVSVLIPSMLEHKIVCDTEELLSIFTNQKYGTLPNVFLYHISQGEFHIVERLHQIFPNQFYKKHLIEFYPMLLGLVRTIGVRNFPKVQQELSKLFGHTFVNRVMGLAFVRHFIDSGSVSGTVASKDAAAGSDKSTENDLVTARSLEWDIKLIHDMGIKFSEADIRYLCTRFPSYAEEFKKIPIFVSGVQLQEPDNIENELASEKEEI